MPGSRRPSERVVETAFSGDDESGSWWSRFVPLLTTVPDSVPPLEFGGRVVVYVGFLLWGLYFLRMPIASAYFNHSFMHLVNTPFHEAGHMILMPLGWSFLTSLGGSLGQIAFPLIVAGALLIKNRDPFGASIGLWWVGQSFMDLSPYIADARALQLMLIGGGTGQEIEGRLGSDPRLSGLAEVRSRARAPGACLRVAADGGGAELGRVRSRPAAPEAADLKATTLAVCAG
jgi:hypothetical protein